MIDNETKELLKSGTLEWCNLIRAEKGDTPLTELPLGVQGDGSSCPCGKATGLYVSKFRYTRISFDITGVATSTEEDLPPVVQEFVYYFDEGEIPELIDSDIDPELDN